MRLGFACVWDPDPARTWSYTPWELRAALRRRPDVDVADVGIELPRAARHALRAASLRRRAGRWVTPWEHLPVWERASATHLGRRARRLGCDAVLQIQDLGVIDTPYIVYQDLSYDVVLGALDAQDATAEGLHRYFPPLDRDAVLRRRDRQLAVYERAAGVLTMSEFLAESLVKVTGLDPLKVHVVAPGASASAVRPAVASRPGPRRRLLFVGTTFLVKGGDTVVAAVEHLRRDHDPDLTVTIVGPDRWPLPGGIPEGVRFLGRQPADRIAALYDAHDLLVVPSRLEGFGKVFVEALARGLPCIGRHAFAMPELIQPGVNGDLVRTEDPGELAAVIAGVLADDALYERSAAGAPAVLDRFTWDRAATDIGQILARTPRQAGPGATRQARPPVRDQKLTI
jgi:glycosyltransferase involved in cell wall biosynthesis